jgi:hypothetical protein
MPTYTCSYCNTNFLRRSGDTRKFRKGINSHIFCSQECQQTFKRCRIERQCGQCDKIVIRHPSDLKNNQCGYVFCSRSCSVTYHNTHKTQGIRRSKLEAFLEEQLKLRYPDLEMQFNQKDAINSELDIYIPSLKLAFELNGIFHYEPIYGQEKLSQIQNNDDRKFQACLEQSIELCIIDTSHLKYFTTQNAMKFIQLVIAIIDQKLPVRYDLTTLGLQNRSSIQLS